jgi:hypothetical protein
MFQKKFMEQVYKKGFKPFDMLWHYEESSPFLVS